MIFADDPLVAGDDARAVHVNQLQTAVNAVRAMAGLAQTTFTPVQIGGLVRASDLGAIRSALAVARDDAEWSGRVERESPQRWKTINELGQLPRAAADRQ